MKITYDKEVDALYISLSDEKNVETQKIDDCTLLDLGKNKKLLGIEILDASKNRPDILKKVTVENLPL